MGERSWTTSGWNEAYELDMTTAPSTERSHSDAEIRIPLGAKVVLGIGLIAIILLTMLGNSVVCFIVLQKPSMRSAINLLLANMALSSILLGLTVMPFAFVGLMADMWPLGRVMCQLEAFLHSLLTSEACGTLLVITVDRYLIIVHRKDRLTPLRAKYAIAATWLASCCLAVPPLAGWGAYAAYGGWMMCVLGEHDDGADKAYVALYYGAAFFLPAAALGLSFAAIAWTVHQHSRRVHSHPDELTAPAVKLGLVLPAPAGASADFGCRMRAFKTILLLSVLFAACWLPHAVAMTVWNCRRRLAENHLGGDVLLWLGYLDSALNPVVYCCRIGKFRDACRAVLPRSLRELSRCPGRVRRRVDPGSAYVHSDGQPAPLQELQVQSFLANMPT